MNEKIKLNSSSSEDSVKSKNNKSKNEKNTDSVNEVQHYYNRDAWFVTTTAAKTKIESRIKQLEKISTEILTITDVAHEEKESHKYLCDTLRKFGCVVHESFIVANAFKAVYNSPSLTDSSNAPTVGLICEYDAIKDFGHSNGNNLLTEATIATFLGIREAMKSDTRLVGRIVILGTPASEENSGKIRMMKEKGFEKIDIIVAVNPSNHNRLLPKFHSYQKIKVTFFGKSRHMDCLNTIVNENPMDAAVLCYNNITNLSNQSKQSARIHCVIKKSGDFDYLVPSKSEIMVCIRGQALEELDHLYKKIVDCAEAASNATQTGVGFNFLEDDMYCCVKHNKVLANVFREQAKTLGIDFKEEVTTDSTIYRSSDLGNISHRVAVIYPSFSIGTGDVPPVHTHEFVKAINRSEAQTNTIRVSIAMTFTIIKYLLNPSLQNEIRQQFENDRNEHQSKYHRIQTQLK